MYVCTHNLHKCGWTAAGSVFTYQFHFVCTECWRHNMPPLPPHIITGGKNKLVDLSINMGSEKATLTLHVMNNTITYSTTLNANRSLEVNKII